ncbi:MAG: alpha/beta hydrolase [Chitinophagaceae bacterium]
MQTNNLPQKTGYRQTVCFIAVTLVLLLSMVMSSCGTTGEKQPSPVTENKAVETKTDSSARPIETPAAPPEGFKHRQFEVNGVQIHYVIGGKGDPLLLIHGFGQNWYMWNRILPELSKHFTVIAPDLPGVGESGKPDHGYDKKALAVMVHELINKLGYSKINVAGHDIGMMVAYSYAVQYAKEVNKLAMMDALIPGIEPVWSDKRLFAWWFGFFGWPASGELVAGRENLFFKNFWPTVGHIERPFTKQEETEFIRAYSVKGATTGAFHWFGAFPQDAKDNLEYAKHKLQMPVLAMGGEFAATYMPEHCRLVAQNVKGVIIKNSGHWLVQENTEQTQKELVAFFTGDDSKNRAGK